MKSSIISVRILFSIMAAMIGVSLALSSAAPVNAQVTISSPYVDESLDRLDFFITANDALWDNPSFQNFIEHFTKYLEEEDKGNLYLSQYHKLKIHQYAPFVRHEDFQKSYKKFSLSEQDREVVYQIITFLESNWDAFILDPKGVWEEYIIPFYDKYDTDLKKYYPQQQSIPLSYAFVTGGTNGLDYTLIESGKVGSLSIYATNLRGLRADWKQTKGPDVSLFKSDSNYTKAFIAPQVSELTYLKFEVRYGTKKWTKKETITIRVQPQYDEIQQLYLTYFGRLPDPEGYAYWSKQYEEGMALSDIAKIFYQSQEYQDKWGAS